MRYAICILLVSCAGVKAGQYAVQLEACLQTSQTCEQYVACRTRIAAENKREFNGKCEAKP